MLTVLGAVPANAGAAPGAAAPSGTPAARSRTVTFGRAELTVPASWPVVDLRRDPDRCVVYDRHAVYLGSGAGAATAGCPAELVGRTDTVQLLPAAAVALGATQRATVAGRPAAVAVAGRDDGGLSVTVPSLGVAVVMTFATDPATDLAILGTLRPAGARPAPIAAATAPALPRPPALPSTAALRAGADRLAAGGARSRRPVAAAASSRRVGDRQVTSSAAAGFDQCTVPTLTQMEAWTQSPYRTVSIYIGGADRACNQADLTPTWITETAALGWDYLPFWVGLQSPCTTNTGVAEITAADATAEGTEEARQAGAAAEALGFGAGTPISLDMEPFPTVAGSSCTRTTQRYFDAWDRQIDAEHFLSAIYVNQGYGFGALTSAYGQSSFREPVDIDLADWDGHDDVTARSAPAGAWAHHQRVHQYEGPAIQIWGGVASRVDVNDVQAAVATLAAAPRPPSNLVSNDDFTDRTVGWRVDPSVRAVPQRAGAVRPPVGSTYVTLSSRQAPQGMYQDLTMTVSTGLTYCASAEVAVELRRGQVGGGRLVLWALGGSAAQSSVVRLPAATGAGRWEQVETCLSVSEPAADLRVEIDPAAGAAPIGVDDADAHLSLAGDGGFNGTAAAWTVARGTNVGVYGRGTTTSPYEGTGYLAVNTRRVSGGVSQTVPYEVGRTSRWCVSAEVVGDALSAGAGGALSLSLLGGRTQTATATFGSLPDRDGWRRVWTCVTATAPHDAIRVVVSPHPDGRTLGVDAVDLS